MADNNKNPRRTIWLSETEPLSHYDIWLSKNQHLNSEGEPLSDSGVQRPCDYIFKVWDCDNWYPIIGFNSTAVNKINTVYNTNYTTTHNGNSINSSSYQEFHLPLFTSPNSSPQELFDAGTIGEAILEYVTEQEWKNIFEGDAFSNSFKQYFENIVNEGDININTLLKPAEANKLGGIWADEFSIEDMFPDTEENHYYTSSQINDSYNWIAQAKYKLNHGTSDYNLYVSAKDVIGAINTYITNNPEAPGIQPSNDFELWLANTERIGGIRAEQDPNTSDDCRNIPIVLAGPTVGSVWGLDFGTPGRRYLGDSDYNTEYLYLPGWALIEWMKNPYFNQQNPTSFISGWRGTSVRGRSDEEGLWVELDNIALAQDGQIPRRKTTNDYVSIEWVDLPEAETYNLLGPDSSAEEKYVVKGGGKAGQYLDYEGEWTEPTGTQYTGGTFISINQGIINIAPYPHNGSFYLNSNDGHLSWASAPEQQNYPTLSSSDHSTGPYVINGCNEPSAAKFFLNGEGGWTEISGGSSGSTSYQSGVGINIDNDDNSININIPDGTTEGQVLSYDGNGDVEWVNLPSQVEGNGINTFVIQNKIYVKSYTCIIQESTFTLDPDMSVSSNIPYSNSRYPFVDFTDYQCSNAVSSITIDSNGTPYLQYPSYMNFTTSTKCTFTFPKTMEFVETKSVNSSTGEDYYYTDTDYIIELQPETKYNVIFYKSCIKFETNSNSIFDTEFNPGT